MFCHCAELLMTREIRGETYNWYQYYYRLEPINQFGKWVADQETEDEELKIVPAWLDDTDDEHGQCLFLECGEMGDNLTMTTEGDEADIEESTSIWGGSRSEMGGTSEEDNTDYNGGEMAQSAVGKALEAGEKEHNEEYFSNLYMGFWDGNILRQGKAPFPVVASGMTDNDFQSILSNFSLSLEYGKGMLEKSYLYHIDRKKKYNFSFLSEIIPDPRSVYYIRGKKYICEKITASFKVNGRSDILKGSFYKVIE